MVFEWSVVPGEIEDGKGVEGVEGVKDVELVRSPSSYQTVVENPMSPHFKVLRRRGRRVMLAA
jgi:hypothetical protein